MPNWCENHLELICASPEQAKILAKWAINGVLFQELVPLKEDNPASALEAWDTKWEPEFDGPFVNENELVLTFRTAWAPPTYFYEKLYELGYGVRALYYEGGQRFYGEFANGLDEGGLAHTFEDLPDEIINAFGVEDWMYSNDQD